MNPSILPNNDSSSRSTPATRPWYLIYALLTALGLTLSRLPLHLGFLVFGAWIPMLSVFDQGRHTRLHLLYMALIFAAVYCGVLLYWIGGVTLIGLTGIFVAYIVLYYTVLYAIQRVWHIVPRWRYPGLICILLSLEYLQNFSEFRFPWINLAYSLSDYTILLQALDLGGVILLSALIILVNILLYRSIRGKLRSLFAVGAILLVWIAYGFWSISHVPMEKHEPQVFVMQPSIIQDDKWEAEQFYEIIERYRRLSHEAKSMGARMLIWPEAAMPVNLMRHTYYRAIVQDLVNVLDMDIFTGFPDYLPAPPEHPMRELHYNAATLFRPHEPPDSLYYKIILVPGGERIPGLKYLPFLWGVQMGQANWEYGTEIRWYQSGDHVFSPSICYEIAFADLNHRMAIHSGGLHASAKIGENNKTSSPLKADYLVNITNDAWFGTSYGPWLHSVLTKFRAVENRIQIYRSANTGISMIVDPKGRILSKTGLFEVRNISAPLYIDRRIPLIRSIFYYPLIFVAFAVIIFAIACLGCWDLRSPGDPIKL